jgi:hypothetical protein
VHIIEDIVLYINEGDRVLDHNLILPNGNKSVPLFDGLTRYKIKAKEGIIWMPINKTIQI